MMECGAGQIERVLTLLGATSMRVYSRQCSKLRHRRSSCTVCMDHCPVQAIHIGETIEIDADRCTGCGICASLCPTGVFEAQAPTDLELLGRVRKVAGDGMPVVFACPRCRQRGEGDADRFVQVNCLGRLDESLLLSAVCDGAETIWLLDAACQECPVAPGRAVAEESVRKANALLQAWGDGRRILFCSQPPSAPGEAARPPAAGEGVSRRAFFSTLARQAARTMAVAADSSRGNGDTGKESSMPEKGVLPSRLPAKRQRLLEALGRLGRPAVESPAVDGMPFARLCLEETCTACQMCAFFCPTGALAKVHEGDRVGLAFRSSACTNCGLCRDVCYRDAVVLSNAVDLSTIMDDVTEVVLMRNAGAAPGLASSEERIQKLFESMHLRNE
jgi:Pyruvate/2-oxoacid:ferredoxin oxidoreductase delta subunit